MWESRCGLLGLYELNKVQRAVSNDLTLPPTHTDILLCDRVDPTLVCRTLGGSSRVMAASSIFDAGTTNTYQIDI